MRPPTITVVASGSMLAKSTVHGASNPDRKHIISYTAGGADGAALLFLVCLECLGNFNKHYILPYFIPINTAPCSPRQSELTRQ